MKPFRLIISLSFFLAIVSMSAEPADTLMLKGEFKGDPTGYPVILKGDTLLYIKQSFGAFTPEQRARGLAERLDRLVSETGFEPDSILSSPVGDDHYITYKGHILMVISALDSLGSGMSSAQLAEQTANTLRQKLNDYKIRFSAETILKNIAYTALIVVVLALIIWILNRLFRWLFRWLEKNKERIFRSIKLQNYEFLPVEREHAIALFLLKLLKIALIITFFLVALPLIFSIFPATEGITRKIVGMVWGPVRNIMISMVNYLPKLVTIIIIFFIFRYLVKFFKFLAREVGNKELVIPGFHPDWAKSSFNIIRVLLYAFMFVMIFPYLPGSGSPVFQGVSVFLGILLSLGSTSLISNSIAGLVITYMRPFKVGDRIKIDDIVGDVVEKTMMITRIRTVKNEDITIPNSKILTSYTVNYSTPTEEREGLIIHTTVTIGYDAPWRTVHKLLTDAAMSTPGVSSKPAPFVLQTSLDDFYVSYQINAYIKKASGILQIRSDLHQNIQDHFNRAGVEIMSPHYRSERDGNDVTIPKDWEVDVPADPAVASGRDKKKTKPEDKK